MREWIDKLWKKRSEGELPELKRISSLLERIDERLEGLYVADLTLSPESRLDNAITRLSQIKTEIDAQLTNFAQKHPQQEGAGSAKYINSLSTLHQALSRLSVADVNSHLLAAKAKLDTDLVEIGKAHELVKEVLLESANSRLSARFSDLAERQAKRVRTWGWRALIALVLGLAWIAAVFIVDIQLDVGVRRDWQVALTYLAPFTVPIGLITAYCLSRFALERRIENTYEHKSTVANSLSAYHELLLAKPEVPDTEARKATRSFMIASARDLYEEPVWPTGSRYRINGQKIAEAAIDAAFRKVGVELRSDEEKKAGTAG